MDLVFLWSIVPRLLDGALVTLIILAQSVIYGLLLAVPIALARVNDRLGLWVPAWLYIFFFRGSPLLVQMYLIYFGFGQFDWVKQGPLWPVLREGYWCAIIALTLNTAGYTAEILRSAIQAVPRGEVEAARALGMPGRMILARIVLPKAFRIGLPAYVNEIIFLLKGSALVFTVTVVDLMGAAKLIYARTFHIYEPLVAAAVLYLLMTFAISRLAAWAEYRLNPDRRPAPTAHPGKS